MLVAGLLLIGAITMRCLIRSRPPVSTLYETVLFVTAVATVIGLGLELMNRRRIAISAAAVFGAIGLFLEGHPGAIDINVRGHYRPLDQTKDRTDIEGNPVKCDRRFFTPGLRTDFRSVTGTIVRFAGGCTGHAAPDD